MIDTIADRFHINPYGLKSRLCLGMINLSSALVLLFIVNSPAVIGAVFAYMALGLSVALMTSGCALLVTVLVELTRQPGLDVPAYGTRRPQDQAGVTPIPQSA